jgi:prepilin-type N-terminal cleavage/methylation domain-containing protein
LKTTISALTRRDRGFTLIELLVVIAIIAILAALILAALSSAQKGSRDSQRKSDLNQYKTALAQYESDNNSYVVANGAVDGTGGVVSSLSPNYMTKFPTPPKYSYNYEGTATSFGMCAELERDAGKMFQVGPTTARVLTDNGGAQACDSPANGDA